MSFTESTIFLCFHSVWMRFFVFSGIVVTLFTLCTCQSNSCTHIATSLFTTSANLFFKHKKKTSFPISLNKCNIAVTHCQRFSLKNKDFSLYFFRYLTPFRSKILSYIYSSGNSYSSEYSTVNDSNSKYTAA